MGRIENLYYTKNKLASELSISRETLNSLEKEEKDLATLLKTGLILKLESKKDEEIPFSHLSKIFKKKTKIKEIKEFPVLKFYFLKKEEIRELIELAFSFVKHYGLTDEELNIFIKERNLLKLRKEKLENEFSILKKIQEINKTFSKE